jgi:hypothetical protein
MPYKKMTIQQIHDEIEKLNAIKEYEKLVCGNIEECDQDTFDKYYRIINDIVFNHIDYDKNDDFYIDMKYDKTKIDFSKFNLNIKDEQIAYMLEGVRENQMTNFGFEIEWVVIPGKFCVDYDGNHFPAKEPDYKSFDAKNCIINVYKPDDSDEEDEDECEEGVPPECKGSHLEGILLAKKVEINY